jgi:hypothetical protein
MSDTPALIEPEFMFLDEFCRRDGCGRTTAYRKIAERLIDARKDGKRIKITTVSARRHWDSLPPAKIKAP